jgi:hypothetical protein
MKALTTITTVAICASLWACESAPPYGNPNYTDRPGQVGQQAVAPAAQQRPSTSVPPASTPNGPAPTPVTQPSPTELTCVSNSMWTKGNSASSRMKPGSDCNGCHNVQGGPIYGISGTVYTAFNEWDDCNGVSKATIEVIGAGGKTVVMNSNSAGNFYASRSKAAALTLPVKARVHFGGLVMEKQKPVSELNCALCHTEWGENGAPGRIVIP